MKRINLYLLTIVISLISWNCDKETTTEEDLTCKRIFRATTDIGYEYQALSTIEYFNSNGYINKSEYQYADPKNNYYQTYKYDTNNNLIEYFDSYAKITVRFIYENNLKIRVENYNSLNELTSYRIFEYTNLQISNQKYYSNSQLDTISKCYYKNGLLDSIVSKGTNYREGFPIVYYKMEYKYNSKGKKIEQSRYSNINSDNTIGETIELLNKEIYDYDENSNMTIFQYVQRNLTVDNKYVYNTQKFKYLYNEYNNLIRTDTYNSNDIYLGSYSPEYVNSINKKLIIPEL